MTLYKFFVKNRNSNSEDFYSLIVSWYNFFNLQIEREIIYGKTRN